MLQNKIKMSFSQVAYNDRPYLNAVDTQLYRINGDWQRNEKIKCNNDSKPTQ